ncbi:DNA/RNA non-specific endonuclease [Pseudomonas amygdali]|uniref:DNA/RNA non-specific endonuclease n=1 Tax=Pseudomonas amygdali TaxID=47877 RepID=UPI003899A343
MRGPAGQPLRATATITENDIKKGGTATNASSRSWARSLGNPDDDAGHIIAKLLGGAGGKNGVFPQLPGINRGLFRDFEKDVAEYVLKKRPCRRRYKICIWKVFNTPGPDIVQRFTKRQAHTI